MWRTRPSMQPMNLRIGVPEIVRVLSPPERCIFIERIKPMQDEGVG